MRTVGDLAALDERVLVADLGAAHGRHLHRLAWALDDRPVEPDRETKSIGHEETYRRPICVTARRARRASWCAWPTASPPGCAATALAARTVTLKVRFGDFRTITRSATLAGADRHRPRARPRMARRLAAAIDPTPGVRLLGVSASNFGAGAPSSSASTTAGRRRGPGDELGWRPSGPSTRSASGSAPTVIGPASAVGDRGCTSCAAARSSGGRIDRPVRRHVRRLVEWLWTSFSCVERQRNRGNDGPGTR